MPTIRCDAKLYNISSWTILRLPLSASKMLPSRALTMVEGTINGSPFKAALEPDGKGSHWFRFDESMHKATKAAAGDTVTLEISPTKEWIEPDVPVDLQKALAASPKAQALWMDITPNARWDWIRWIRAVKTQETREKHIAVALSKLNKGMRRPCCFNRNLCSEPSVAKNWVLLEPTQVQEI
jgi:bacteriocin resistance YdeI/OmpD-like protein/uncharacterized protein DUF1905